MSPKKDNPELTVPRNPDPTTTSTVASSPQATKTIVQTSPQAVFSPKIKFNRYSYRCIVITNADRLNSKLILVKRDYPKFESLKHYHGTKKMVYPKVNIFISDSGILRVHGHVHCY